MWSLLTGGPGGGSGRRKWEEEVGGADTEQGFRTHTLKATLQ